MPVVVRLARQLYLQRVEEIKSQILKEQEEFGRLSSEIDSIKSGKWDKRLEESISSTDETANQNQPVLTEEKGATTTETEADSTSENVVDHVGSIIEQENHLKRTLSESKLESHHEFKRSRVNDKVTVNNHTNEEQVTLTAICETEKHAITAQTSLQKTVIDVDVKHTISGETIKPGISTTDDMTAKMVEKEVDPVTSEVKVPSIDEQKDNMAIADTEHIEPNFNEQTDSIENEHVNSRVQRSVLPRIIIPEQQSQQDQPGTLHRTIQTFFSTIISCK